MVCLSLEEQIYIELYNLFKSSSVYLFKRPKILTIINTKAKVSRAKVLTLVKARK